MGLERATEADVRAGNRALAKMKEWDAKLFLADDGTVYVHSTATLPPRDYYVGRTRKAIRRFIETVREEFHQ